MPEVELELVVLVAVVVLEDVLFCACMLVVLLEVWLLFVAWVVLVRLLTG